jgi:D-sedoheptulose 7-phosphate isomerase
MTDPTASAASAASAAGPGAQAAFGTLPAHLRHVREALADLERQAELIDCWGAELATVLGRGGRLLAAGNGGSAAEAQHLTAELVGRFETDRRPLSAIALHAETSSLTAIVNDFGGGELFARQIAAHGRPGDVLLLLTTSGRSTNLLRAAESGRRAGLRVWAMTGRCPNPLADVVDEALAVACPSPTAVQESHLVAVHALCAGVERWLALHPSLIGKPTVSPTAVLPVTSLPEPVTSLPEPVTSLPEQT